MVKQALSWFLTPYYGSNRLSRLIRTKIERVSTAELIGIPLIALVFLAAVVVPQTEAGLENTAIYFDSQETTTITTPMTDSRFRWPLATFGLSQYYSGGHQGLDMTNPAGTPIYPIAPGKVITSTSLFNGYGKHVIIDHGNGMTAIYAHMSRIEVITGQVVGKMTELGTVGATGWATGNHLHFEILQDGIALNPMEVLPSIRLYEPTEPALLSRLSL